MLLLSSCLASFLPFSSLALRLLFACSPGLFSFVRSDHLVLARCFTSQRRRTCALAQICNFFIKVGKKEKKEKFLNYFLSSEEFLLEDSQIFQTRNSQYFACTKQIDFHPQVKRKKGKILKKEISLYGTI